MRFKAQSAMEYLMTYGWAILIIAVVLAALFTLGIFNIGGPRAQPGSCEVYRPYGPGTDAGVSLAGQCNNLVPQTVPALDDPLSGNYPGNPQEYIAINNIGGFPLGSSARSAFAWIYVNSQFATDTPAQCQLNFGNCWYSVFQYGICGQTGALFDLILFGYNNAPGLEVSLDGNGEQWQSSLAVSPNTWHFIGVTYTAASNTLNFYLDGNVRANVASVAGSGNFINTVLGTNPQSTIGANKDDGCNSGGFPGSIANVQLYNTTLSNAEVQALYMEGIGGAPVSPNYIVGWWPLNENANDYSGNGNNGVPQGITFQGSWTSGYTAP